MIVLYREIMNPSTHETTKPKIKPRHSVTGTPVQVRLQPTPLALIDHWRREQPDIPNRAEAIRRLIEQALREKRR
jgi:hypothetical protein